MESLTPYTDNLRKAIVTGQLTPYDVIEIALEYLRTEEGLNREDKLRIVEMIV